MYDTKLLIDWDHTSAVVAGIHNLTVTVISALSKAKPKPKLPSAFHPYRQTPKPGLKVTSKDMSALKLLGYALAGGR